MYLSTLFLHLVNRGKFTRVQCLTLLHVHCTIALDGRINKSKKDNSNFKYDFRQISTSFLSETNLELSVLAKDKVAPPHLLPSKFNKYTLYSEKLSADTQ